MLKYKCIYFCIFVLIFLLSITTWYSWSAWKRKDSNQWGPAPQNTLVWQEVTLAVGAAEDATKDLIWESWKDVFDFSLTQNLFIIRLNTFCVCLIDSSEKSVSATSATAPTCGSTGGPWPARSTSWPSSSGSPAPGNVPECSVVRFHWALQIDKAQSAQSFQEEFDRMMEIYLLSHHTCFKTLQQFIAIKSNDIKEWRSCYCGETECPRTSSYLCMFVCLRSVVVGHPRTKLPSEEKGPHVIWDLQYKQNISNPLFRWK